MVRRDTPVSRVFIARHRHPQPGQPEADAPSPCSSMTMTRGYSHVCRTGFSRARIQSARPPQRSGPYIQPRRSGVRHAPRRQDRHLPDRGRHRSGRPGPGLYPRAWPASAPRSPSTPNSAGEFTWPSNTVAIVTDGTAVLGLGDIGPTRRAAGHGGQGGAVQRPRRRRRGADLPGLHRPGRDRGDLAGSRRRFGAIHLEDISAPRCFEIEDRLRDAARHARCFTTTSTAPPS